MIEPNIKINVASKSFARVIHYEGKINLLFVVRLCLMSYPEDILDLPPDEI